ncbi:Hypothetical predicted protein [Olea europaea subsp. europaea]|uniref:Uncharacterized protein n=1 Tax=Olea europaea subsp. europaea TaxID=158383 RepID=A0A8S0QV56_OLEEU|nr:Hypothetical predicted protein [Olea europaea subsp. europaea]
MDSGSSSAPQYAKNGSVYPKEKKPVSTMMGEKMAEASKKVVKSTVTAVKKHNDKGKISPNN